MSNRYKTGILGAWIGIVVNILLMIVKGLAGFLANSQAMKADALHSGADIFASLAVIVGMYIASKPADREHPYGHGKAETIATKIIALIIVLAGLNVATSSLKVFFEGVAVAPGSLALWAALFSILVKETTYRYTHYLGEKVDCKVLLANSWEHRSDVFSSIAALVGIGAARIGDFLGYPFFLYMDPLAGLLVSVLIIRMGLRLAGEAAYELMDASAREDIIDDIREFACSVKGVTEVHDVKARSAGPYILVDLRIGVRCDLTVKEGHDIATKVKQELLSHRDDILEVIVHVNPCEVDGYPG
ncbi:MAG: cation transporter [Candidatus Syntrophonatronum acetioxidans]|uniref:Cation transporter n=1 Tax=Candidatus Syntrophonatronum acetioxidans TaxID=1795816 RepID=A0A424YIM4_9FIRM|nr:MAG: cation transporter [Candidatus Syntrophonatronum acetioxidans]